MDNELAGKIKEIGGLLGIENVPDNIGELLGSFLGDNGSDEKDSETKTEAGRGVSCSNEKEQDDSLGIDPVMLIKIMSGVKQAQEKGANDDKVRLLKALKPFLSDTRRKKVDNCVNILMFKELAPLLGQLGK